MCLFSLKSQVLNKSLQKHAFLCASSRISYPILVTFHRNMMLWHRHITLLVIGLVDKKTWTKEVCFSAFVFFKKFTNTPFCALAFAFSIRFRYNWDGWNMVITNIKVKLVEKENPDIFTVLFLNTLCLTVVLTLSFRCVFKSCTNMLLCTLAIAIHTQSLLNLTDANCQYTGQVSLARKPGEENRTFSVLSHWFYSEYWWKMLFRALWLSHLTTRRLIQCTLFTCVL